MYLNIKTPYFITVQLSLFIRQFVYTSKSFVVLICQDNIESEAHKNVLSYFKTY